MSVVLLSERSWELRDALRYLLRTPVPVEGDWMVPPWVENGVVMRQGTPNPRAGFIAKDALVKMNTVLAPFDLRVVDGVFTGEIRLSVVCGRCHERYPSDGRCPCWDAPMDARWDDCPGWKDLHK